VIQGIISQAQFFCAAGIIVQLVVSYSIQLQDFSLVFGNSFISSVSIFINSTSHLALYFSSCLIQVVSKLSSKYTSSSTFFNFSSFMLFFIFSLKMKFFDFVITFVAGLI
jgi:hypothetical protein